MNKKKYELVYHNKDANVDKIVIEDGQQYQHDSYQYMPMCESNELVLI